MQWKGERRVAAAPATQLRPPTHQGGWEPQLWPGATGLCAGCKGWGLVYAPPRLSVCVCERVAGTEEDTVFWTWAEARCQVGIVSSCLGQIRPGRGILSPLLIFLGTWNVVKIL